MGSSTSQASTSPQKRMSTHSNRSSAISASSIEYQPGELPHDFHRRVVDLEIKIEMHGVSAQKDKGNEE